MDTLTVKEFAESQSPIDAWIIAQGKALKVSYIRWWPRDPWAVTPEGNGGLGCSWCVHGGTMLYRSLAAAQAAADYVETLAKLRD